MSNITDPVVQKFIDDLHESIDRKNKNLSTTYDTYVLENRVIKFFCADKYITPRDCAEQMNARYETALNDKDIIRLLKAHRLSIQIKRGELLNWAANLAEAFATALESRTQTDFDKYLALRGTVIYTRDGKESYKIQDRIACLMLYVRYPELFSDADAETIEQFGNVYMKQLLNDATDLLRNICGTYTFVSMTVEDFLQNDPDAQNLLIAPNYSAE